MQFCRIDKRMAQKWENCPSFLKRKYAQFYEGFSLGTNTSVCMRTDLC